MLNELLIKELSNQVDSNTEKLSGMIYTENINLATGLSINANTSLSTRTYTLTPREGYTPILVVLNNSWGGEVLLWYCNLNSTTNVISWRVKNITSSNISNYTIQIRVLYIKNELVLSAAT